ncbi:MAG: ATP-binding cassette domain-containing protein [Candidatus Cloacimonetes bacterium]|nr:ATP-binding cassette domain-containing protein [Candidatus Cloacimonadota bacterium]
MYRIDGLAFSYKQSRELFAGLSIRQQGAILLCGENGCGKSTLLKLLAGLLHPLAGRISYDSQDLEQLGSKLYRQIFYLEQDAEQNLVGITPKDDIGIWKLALRLPDTLDVLSEIGLGYCSEQQISLMSQGEKKLLALGATPWLMDRLWLLDEPLSGLDKDKKAWFIELLRAKIARNPDCIVCSHERELLIPLFDEIWHLENGRIAIQSLK